MMLRRSIRDATAGLYHILLRAATVAMSRFATQDRIDAEQL